MIKESKKVKKERILTEAEVEIAAKADIDNFIKHLAETKDLILMSSMPEDMLSPNKEKE